MGRRLARESLRPRAWLGKGSLRVRVLAAAAVLVTITSAVMGLLGTALLHGYLLSRVDAQLQSFASPTRAAQARRALASRHAHPPRPGPFQLPSDFVVEIVDANGRIHLAPGSQLRIPRPSLSAAQLRDTGEPFTAAAVGAPGHSWRVLVRPLSGGRHLVTGLGLDDVNSTVTHLALIDAAAGAIGIALLAAVGLILVRASLAPLTRIEETAEAIAGGDLSRRIAHPSERTEVGRLATALNTMLGRIEAAYRARETGEAHARDSEDRMRRFVADASHELRTPLTSIKGLAEFGLQKGEAADRDELLRLISRIQQESSRMGLLVEDLLLLARLDQDRPLDRRPVDLTSIAAEAVHAARTVQPGRPVTLLAAPEPVIVDADDARIRQVIDNLISNALQHTPAGSPVTVAVDAGSGHGTLAVTDRGPGMTAEQAARVFERFYRTDGARTRARGGTGLGLSISAALVAAHGGSISVQTEPGCGATFRVRLALAGVGTSPADTDASPAGDTKAGPAGDTDASLWDNASPAAVASPGRDASLADNASRAAVASAADGRQAIGARPHAADNA
jgi:two-component system OmpR family sensor kinase